MCVCEAHRGGGPYLPPPLETPPLCSNGGHPRVSEPHNNLSISAARVRGAQVSKEVYLDRRRRPERWVQSRVRRVSEACATTILSRQGQGSTDPSLHDYSSTHECSQSLRKRGEHGRGATAVQGCYQLHPQGTFGAVSSLNPMHTRGCEHKHKHSLFSPHTHTPSPRRARAWLLATAVPVRRWSRRGASGRGRGATVTIPVAVLLP